MDNRLGFSVITSLCRTYCLERLMSNFNRQKFEKKELIIIINNDDIDVEIFDDYIKKQSNIKVYKLPQEVNLGMCLNYAVSKSSYELVAKFDDDDFYSPYYLDEMYKAFEDNNCDVVGKARFFYYIDGINKFIEHPRYAQHQSMHKENDYVKWLAGATLCIKKSVFEQVQFADINSCIDNEFMKECVEKNIKAYATSKFNFMAYRNIDKDNHTWKISDEELLERCKLIEDNISIDDAYNKIFREV